MWDTLQQLLQEHATLVRWVALGSGAMLLLSMLALPAVAVLLPQDFIPRQLDQSSPEPREHAHPALRITLKIIKNLAGGLLAVAGLAMLVLPGQGLLTLAFALLLLDLPGKQKLEARVLSNAKLLNLINRLRRRFDRPPLAPAPPS